MALLKRVGAASRNAFRRYRGTRALRKTDFITRAGALRPAPLAHLTNPPDLSGDGILPSDSPDATPDGLLLPAPPGRSPAPTPPAWPLLGPGR